MAVLMIASVPPTAADPVAISPTSVIIASPIAFQTTAFTTDLRRVSIPSPIVLLCFKIYRQQRGVRILNMINKTHQL